MSNLYIAIILLFRIVQALFSKRSSMEINSIPLLVVYSSYKNAVSAVLGLMLILIADNGFNANRQTVIIASISGLALFFSEFCNIYAMKSGTVSLISLFGTAGMIIPIIAGVALFDKPAAPMQLIGLGMFFAAAYLLVSDSKSVYKNFSFKTLLLLIGSMLSNDFVMLAQQLFTRYVPDGDVSVFSFLSFAIIAVLSGCFYKLLSSDCTENNHKMKRRLIKPPFLIQVKISLNKFV